MKAHARAWHIYDDFYRATQQGECGITLDSGWIEPKTNETQDIEAAERARQFKLGWFAHPIFSATGDYPSEMKEVVARHSAEEGLSESRLPEFDAAWISYIKGKKQTCSCCSKSDPRSFAGSSDFFGLNHYTTGLCEYSIGGDIPSFVRDQDNTQSSDPSWPESEAAPWIKVVPWGFRKLLNWIKDEYNNPRLIVTENGFADYGELNDAGRVEYYRFGLYHVDFSDDARPRTQKESARFFAQLISDNGFPAPKTP
ncbi:hypothetical protein B566_EDAN011754 [Ephemera danica]|nr:hypothetical protein B566_EDAN011754 [Ephemera danica]